MIKLLGIGRRGLSAEEAFRDKLLAAIWARAAEDYRILKKADCRSLPGIGKVGEIMVFLISWDKGFIIDRIDKEFEVGKNDC